MPAGSKTIITDCDLFRLQRRARTGALGQSALLTAKLARALVVPSHRVPASVVTMNSRLALEDIHTRKAWTLTLVYPEDADPGCGHISVQTATGAALLGLSVGEEIDWPLPSGRTARLRLVGLPYQPEAAGDLHL